MLSVHSSIDVHALSHSRGSRFSLAFKQKESILLILLFFRYIILNFFYNIVCVLYGNRSNHFHTVYHTKEKAAYASIPF